MTSFVKHATHETSEHSYYNININENSHFNISVIGKTYPDNKYSITRSRSASHAIEVIHEGKQIMKVNGKTIVAEHGDCVIIKQKACFTSTSDPNNPVKKTWICFRGHLIDFLYQMYGIHDDITIVKADLKNEIEDFYNELLGGDALSSAAVKTHSLMQKLSEALKKKNRSPKSNLSEQVCRILNDNIFGEVSLEDICEQFFVSKIQLIRSFKKDYGITPYRYFLLKKIDLAKDFLKNTDQPLKYIATTLNFSDEQYFCKVFKNVVGLSPGQYRKM